MLALFADVLMCARRRPVINTANFFFFLRNIAQKFALNGNISARTVGNNDVLFRELKKNCHSRTPPRKIYFSRPGG